MQCIELTASLRVPEILPGGGFVASVGEASADHREDARSKVTAMDPRQDEEQIAFACEIGLEPVESERDNGQDR